MKEKDTMTKKYISFIIFMIISANKIWAGNPVLQLYDDEVEQRSFSRVLDNLEDFYVVNSAQIMMLNTQNFFADPEHPSATAKQALKQIKNNRQASITYNYLGKYRLLKKHLFGIRGYFKEDKTAEDLRTSQASDLLNYTEGLLLILYGLGVR